MERHGGAVEDERLGKGATLTILFPRRPVDDMMAAPTGADGASAALG